MSWRSSFGATEDRNYVITVLTMTLILHWRSPSGAAEDRNEPSAVVSAVVADLAVAFRGD